MDNLAIQMLGTGSPRPDLERSGPAQILWIGDTPVLIDCGEGTTNQLLKAGVAPERVKYLFLTHLHSDHLFGYAQFLIGGQGNGRRELTVIGPKGTRQYHERIIEMYKEDIEYRLSLGRSPKGLMDVKVIEIARPGGVEVDLPVSITVERMIHNVPTYGYRFEKDGKVIVVSGDTAPTEKLIDFARKADILVQDAALTTTSVYTKGENKEFERVYVNLQKEHCSPLQCGEIAQKANVKKLVMTHFLPESDTDEAYREASKVFSGTVIAAEDLQYIKP